MGMLTWVLVGLVAGFIAEFVLSGGPSGIGLRRVVLTVGLGVVGAIVGGFISTGLGYGDVTGFNVRSLAIAVGGAILVIAAWRMFAGGSGKRRFS